MNLNPKLGKVDLCELPSTASEPYNAGLASSTYTHTADKTLNYTYSASNLFINYILVAIPKGFTRTNAPILSSIRLKILVLRGPWDCKIIAIGMSNTYITEFRYAATTDKKIIDLYEAMNIDVSDENYLNVKFEIISVTLSQDTIANQSNSTAPFTAQGLAIINKFQL